VAKRVMFYCQHVLGMGHLVRSTEIIRELARDFSVLFVTGGEVPQDFRFPEGIDNFQLIPLKSSPDFSDLLLCDFSWDLEETKAIRRELLLHAFDEFQPDVLITELFPFGRKQFSFELLPLLDRARSRTDRTMIVSSIRDILVNRKDQESYEQRVCGIVNDYYDLVLVHGDDRFQTLKDSFSRVDNLKCPVAYTGYVVQQTQHSGSSSAVTSGRPLVVVSNGSGMCPSGHDLLEQTLHAAAALDGKLPHQFQVFAGPLMPEGVYSRLSLIAAAQRNVTFTRYTPDLPSWLRRADLSISMAGYNTVMDILSAGVRSLVYPVTGNSDEEQSIRAAKLAARGALGVLETSQLQPDALALRIQSALNTQAASIHLNVNGAANSSLLLKKYLALRDDSLSCPAYIHAPSQYAAGANL
jgi:predicted glycosyltransferase